MVAFGSGLSVADYAVGLIVMCLAIVAVAATGACGQGPRPRL